MTIETKVLARHEEMKLQKRIRHQQLNYDRSVILRVLFLCFFPSCFCSLDVIDPFVTDFIQTGCYISVGQL